MAKLGVNVDHIANIRQARRSREPDPVTAALIAELAGAEGITIHLRSDRRHIQDDDLASIRNLVKTKLNLEMAATNEMIAIARRYKPDTVTLVPEKPQELTTEGGLNIKGCQQQLHKTVASLQQEEILVGIFIDPEIEQLSLAKQVGADFVELHTGIYAAAKTPAHVTKELTKIITTAQEGSNMGLEINAGHDLDYRNVIPIAAIPEINELNIGFQIIARAVFIGLHKAVAEMLRLIKSAR